jgi:hypothetical protein
VDFCFNSSNWKCSIDEASSWRKGVSLHSLRYLEVYQDLLLSKELTFSLAVRYHSAIISRQ